MMGIKFLVLVLFISHDTGYTQAIPVGTDAICVRHVQFDRAVKMLAAAGYSIDVLDKHAFFVKTKFKDVPNSICHISINVRVNGDSAFIKGQWWTNLAPASQSAANICRVVRTSPGGLNLIFDEMDKYAKSLKGPVVYRQTEKISFFGGR